jgi:fibronectin type 3 domain-containing protein
MKKLLTLFLLLSSLLATAQATQSKPHKVTLKWDAPAADKSRPHVVGYNVYRSDTEKGKYTAIARKITAHTYIDSKVQSGHTYYYRVTSVDVSGRESTAATTTATIP